MFSEKLQLFAKLNTSYLPYAFVAIQCVSVIVFQLLANNLKLVVFLHLPVEDILHAKLQTEMKNWSHEY